MKTVKELFELVAQATEENSQDFQTWFFNFSGHINTLSVEFYFSGWEMDKKHPKKIEQELTEEGTQALYWFIKTRLRNVNTIIENI